jgi:hypothetical protein
LVNGKDNSITIADTNNIYVSQPVWVSSKTVVREQRKVLGIEKVGDASFIITLNGDPDLAKLKIFDTAVLEAFLPDTVNSRQFIFKQSKTHPTLEDFQTKKIATVDQFDSTVAIGGVNFLLNGKNDLIITHNSDVKLAVGLQNIVQNVRIALSTLRGDMMQHPGFGLPFRVGDSTADVSAKDILKSIQEMFSNGHHRDSLENPGVRAISTCYFCPGPHLI